MGVKVHLLKRVAGPSGNWGPGSTIEVAKAEADALVAAGAAELIDSMVPFVAEADVKAPAEAGEAQAKAKKETAVEKPSGKREKATEA